MKKYINSVFALILALCALCSTCLCAYGEEETVKEPSTDNVLVIKNMETGNNLPLKSAQSKKYQAGLAAKLMNLLVSYENLKDADIKISIPICATEAALRGNSSYIGFAYKEESQSLTTTDLFNAVAVATANDACVALAVATMRYKAGEATDFYGNYDGAVAASLMEKAHINDFVSLMNSRATELGCENTRFTNCNGLSDSGSYTTAEDIALIAEKILAYPELAELMDKSGFKLSTGGNEIKSKSAFKVSTGNIQGYTKLANLKNMMVGPMSMDAFCAVATAEDNGLTYVFVAIADNPGGGSDTFEQAQKSSYDTVKAFLPWALTSFKYMEIISTGNAEKTLPVKSGKSSDSVTIVASDKIELLITKDIDPDKDVEVVYSYTEEELSAPVSKGQKVGEAVVYLRGTEIGRVDLITNAAIEESEVLSLLDKVLQFLNSDGMKKVYICALALIGGYLVLTFLLFIYRVVRKYVAASKGE